MECFPPNETLRITNSNIIEFQYKHRTLNEKNNNFDLSNLVVVIELAKLNLSGLKIVSIKSNQNSTCSHFKQVKKNCSSEIN